jgi:hypothetical protein
MKKFFSIFFVAVIFICCKQETTQQASESSQEFVDQENESTELLDALTTAHRDQNFKQYEIAKFDIDLDFGGNDRLDATMYVSTDSKYIRIEKNNGDVILYDSEKVWLSPVTANERNARFDIFTWSYFFALPYKLQDPGTIIEIKAPTDQYNRAKLTFESGTGDAPDDWYELYVDPESDLLQYAGYIVTYRGTDIQQAEENAHAIGYQNYELIDGIPIATRWKFYNYKDEVDTSTVIGNATISNISFLEMQSGLFEKPKDAKEIKL